MVNVEIEILSAEAKEHIYALRNYLAQKIDQLNISVKEQPALEGQMSPFTSECILNGFIHAGVGIGIEQCIHIVWPVIKDWFRTVNIASGEKLEVLATLGDTSNKVTISEDSEGVSKRYDNVTYTIDRDRTRAILIGSSEFENDFLPIPPVKNNLEDLYRVLADKRNIGLPPENITVVLDKSNTEIEEQLLRVSKLPDTDTLLVYFSGHGYRSDISKLYLIARNTRKIDDYILGGIDYDFIKNVILKSPGAKQKIIILDACHSGIATQGTVGDSILDINVMGTYVMASSESDEVSYYDKNKRNTFFTAALLDTLTKGIDNTRDMLALNDLYEGARNHLDQKQLPRFKDKLNISAADFFIARNPSFSFEKSIQYARQLHKAGNLTEALREYRKLSKRLPGNEELKELIEQCNGDLLIAQFIKQGDEFFYRKHDFQKALESYKEAYEIKPDFATAEKIKDCKKYIDQGLMGSPAEPPYKNPVYQEDADKEPVPEPKEEEFEKRDIPKKTLALIIAAVVIGLGWLLLHIFNRNEEKTNFAELKSMLDKDPGQALALLREARPADSAALLMGGYFRGDKKYDSAIYFYEKAIAASHLPAAYSSLGDMYYNGEFGDTSKNPSAYAILKEADSLYKDDTLTDYLLASIVQSKGNTAKKLMDQNPDLYFNDAERLFQKGYKKGCRQCGMRLGFIYLDRKEKPAAAFPLLKEAAENNFSEAQVYISDMLAWGIGVAKDRNESDKWFRAYMDNADSYELVNTAIMYAADLYTGDNGYYLRKDCAKALLLIQAAEGKINQMNEASSRFDIYMDIAKFYKNPGNCRDSIKGSQQKVIDYYKKSAALQNLDYQTFMNIYGFTLK